MFNLDSDI